MSATEKRICAGCQGSGKCSKCEGSGHIFQSLPTPKAVISGTITSESPAVTRRTCPRCFGSGVCQACKGEGSIE